MTFLANLCLRESYPFPLLQIYSKTSCMTCDGISFCIEIINSMSWDKCGGKNAGKDKKKNCGTKHVPN